MIPQSCFREWLKKPQAVQNDVYQQFAAAGAAHVDPKIVQQDLNQLKALVDKIEEYADRRIAHRDRSRFPHTSYPDNP